MRRLMKAASPEALASSPFKHDLEINPRHSIIIRLNSIRQSDPALAGKITEQLYDNALVAAGLLEDPRSMLTRLNELLEQVVATR
jgi:HSP90 family molecular chaperone